MKLTLNIKPKKVLAETKNEVLKKISSDHLYCHGKYGNYLMPYPKLNLDTIRVYSLEKRRKSVTRKVVNGKSQSDVISPNHWVGYYYDIPESLLKLGSLKVKQLDRTYDILTLN